MKNTKVEYRGKHFIMPNLSPNGFEITPDISHHIFPPQVQLDNPIFLDFNSIWDLDKFLIPRTPVSLGILTENEDLKFSNPNSTRVLDMPIKFPGSNFRIPKEFEQFLPTIQRIAKLQ